MSACPDCLHFGSTVVMTRRLRGGWVKRWRRCQQEECAAKWTTYEIPTAAIELGVPEEDLIELKPPTG